MSRDITPFALRMPAELRGQIEEAASSNKRSLNAEVVARLQDSFETSATVAGRATVLELKSLMTEVSLISALLSMVQQQPQSQERDGLLKQLVERVDAMGDIPKLFTELMKALPLEQPDQLQVEHFTLEKRGDKPSATAKRPLRKTSRPLGMDQAEWEALKAAENKDT